MVAVRMVSEGVDVPRLAVGVYATSTATPLFFAQAVGRFVRARRRGETASVFLPSVPLLLQHAAEMELERDHALDRPRRRRGRPVRPRGRAAGGGQPGCRRRPASDELDLRGARGRGDLRPGALRRRRVRHPGRGRLRGGGRLPRPPRAARAGPGGHPAARAAEQRHQVARGRRTAAAAASAGRGGAHRAVPALRKELNGLVGAWHHRTGIPHGAVHTELRQACGGPPAAQASAEQLQARIDLIRSWALRRR